MNILLIDDDELFRQRIKKTLKRNSCYLSEADTVTTARKKILEQDFQAYFIDLKMPGELGISLIHDIKEKSPTAKIILLTGYGSASIVSQAFKLGATDFLSKPVSTVELLVAIGLQKESEPKSNTSLPTLDQIEQEYLHKVLVDYDGNISQAAKSLGLHRRSLQRKLAK